MPMTDSELKALLAQEERSALGYLSSELSDQRRRAMEYYLGEPFGDEREGRSQVVSRDVSDTVEGILPALLDIFTAGDDVVRFEPQNKEDEPAAQQATEYVNWVFLRDNPGFLVLYSMFKDALLQKTGIVKVYWEKTEEEQVQTYAPGEIPPDAVAVLRQEDPDAEYIEEEDGSLTIRRVVKGGKVCCDPVPPEEFLISRDARSIEDARCVTHRTKKTITELIEMGYPRKTVESLSGGDTDAEWQDERLARYDDIDEDVESIDDAIDPSMRKVWLREAYIRVDYDQDGKAEMRRIVYAGNGSVILVNEPWDGPRPFAAISPILMPHRWLGLSVADLVMDIQRIKSTLWRQMLDNLYLSNNPRHVISESVNLDDYLTARPGGAVRLKDGALPGQGHIAPLAVPFVAADSFPMLEYADSVRENRTGVTRYNQGLDANSLNKTASGISQIMSAAQQRIRLIARVFAETGVKDIFRLILFCVTKYQDRARIVRLRNEWVPIDPREWKNQFDISINVGLGTGNRDQMLAHLSTLLGIQVQAIEMQGGIDGPLITGPNVHETISKMVQNMGFKSPELFVTDPRTQPPKPPPPDPKMIEMQGKLQIEQQKLQVDAQKVQTEASLEERRLQQELALRREQIQAEIALKREQLAAELQLKREQIEAELALKREANAMNAAVKASTSAVRPGGDPG